MVSRVGAGNRPAVPATRTHRGLAATPMTNRTRLDPGWMTLPRHLRGWVWHRRRWYHWADCDIVENSAAWPWSGSGRGCEIRCERTESKQRSVAPSRRLGPSLEQGPGLSELPIRMGRRQAAVPRPDSARWPMRRSRRPCSARCRTAGTGWLERTRRGGRSRDKGRASAKPPPACS
jgi:hypothetical protein